MHRKYIFGTFMMDCALGGSSPGFQATPKKILGGSASSSRTRHGQKCPSRSRGLDGALHNFCRIASFPARARFRTRLVTKPKRLRSFPSSSDSKKSYWPKTAIISCRSRKPAASWAVFQPLRMAKWPTSNLPFSILRCFYT